jgi:phage shock protein A
MHIFIGAPMNILKRFTRTVFSHVDSVVTQIENHEGLAAAALADAQRALAKVRIQERRLRSTHQQLSQRIAQLASDAATWQTRATQLGMADREGALECLRRRKRCESERLELTNQLREHELLQAQILADIETTESKVAAMKRRLEALRAREANVHALAALSDDRNTGISEVDDLFERWDAKITEVEIITGTREPADLFAHRLASQEELASLERELDELIVSRS